MRDARMNWGMTEFLGIQKIVWLYKAEICGWPKNIPFQAPSALKASDCTAILRGIRRGQIFFRKTEPRIRERYASMQNSTVHAQVANVGRADKNEKLPLDRPQCHRTKRQPKKPVKSDRLVPEERNLSP